MDRLQEAVDKLEEEKLIEITIPDVSRMHDRNEKAVVNMRHCIVHLQ